jgi:UDP-glucuronate 4-epimerase
MKILITGTAGFIGYHLTNKMLSEKHFVVGIDSINNYYDVNLKYGRLRTAGIDTEDIKYNVQITSSTNPNYSFYKLSLEDKPALDELFNTHDFDIVVNLAAQAGVRYSVENPYVYIESNILGFLNILECSKNKVKHLVYASSSSVYGMNNEEVFSTAHGVDHPVSLYAATKRSNELMAHVYSNMYNLPVTGVRFFTVYGPWGRPDMALFLFTKAIFEDKPIKVYNNGDMLRDFTYIDDVVEGIRRIVDGEPPQRIQAGTDQHFDPASSYAPFKIYNIGNNSPVRLLDFIDLLEVEIGKKAIKEMLPIQAGDVYKTYADVKPLIEQFDYKPNTSLQKGVKDFVEWYKSFYKQ